MGVKTAEGFKDCLKKKEQIIRWNMHAYPQIGLCIVPCTPGRVFSPSVVSKGKESGRGGGEEGGRSKGGGGGHCYYSVFHTRCDQ